MQLMKLKLGAVTYLGYDFRVSGNEIEYKVENGATRTLYINGCSFSFEPTETRDWVVVLGRGSKEFWAEHQSAYCSSTETFVQNNLTEEEAVELSKELSRIKNKYQF